MYFFQTDVYILEDSINKEKCGLHHVERDVTVKMLNMDTTDVSTR